MIKSCNYDNNFWEQNDNVLFLSFYRTIYKKDKSTNKKESSKTMWAVMLYCYENPINPYFKLSKDDRVEEIKTLFEIDIEAEQYVELVNKFVSDSMDNVEKELRTWRLFLLERDNYIKTLEYGKDTVEKESLLNNYKNIWASYYKAEQEAQSHFQKAKGGRTESALEKGLI